MYGREVYNDDDFESLLMCLSAPSSYIAAYSFANMLLCLRCLARSYLECAERVVLLFRRFLALSNIARVCYQQLDLW
jgi:hypothetical protein